MEEIVSHVGNQLRASIAALEKAEERNRERRLEIDRRLSVIRLWMEQLFENQFVWKDNDTPIEIQLVPGDCLLIEHHAVHWTLSFEETHSGPRYVLSCNLGPYRDMLYSAETALEKLVMSMASEIKEIK